MVPAESGDGGNRTRATFPTSSPTRSKDGDDGLRTSRQDTGPGRIAQRRQGRAGAFEARSRTRPLRNSARRGSSSTKAGAHAGVQAANSRNESKTNPLTCGVGGSIRLVPGKRGSPHREVAETRAGVQSDKGTPPLEPPLGGDLPPALTTVKVWRDGLRSLRSDQYSVQATGQPPLVATCLAAPVNAGTQISRGGLTVPSSRPSGD